MKTNEEAVDRLIEDLRDTPHAVGLALLRERLLHISEVTRESIEKNPDAWVNPIFPPALYVDLCRRIDQYLSFENEKRETMKKSINKHVPVDLGHLRGEPTGTVLDVLIKEAKEHHWRSEEVALLVKESTSDGSDKHFWKVICLYTDTKEEDLEEDTRCVRYGISDIIVGPEEEPSKYAQVFDVNGKLLGEAEVYIIGYESCEEE